MSFIQSTFEKIAELFINDFSLRKARWKQHRPIDQAVYITKSLKNLLPNVLFFQSINQLLPLPSTKIRRLLREFFPSHLLFLQSRIVYHFCNKQSGKKRTVSLEPCCSHICVYSWVHIPLFYE